MTSTTTPSSFLPSFNPSSIIHKTITGTGMFFVGCGIGIVMNLFFQDIIERYEEDHLIQMLISVTQLIMISFIVYTFQEQVHTMGLFISGILMAQELFIMKMIPRKKESHHMTEKKQEFYSTRSIHPAKPRTPYF